MSLFRHKGEVLMMDEVNMVERERKLVGTPKVASLKSLELKK